MQKLVYRENLGVGGVNLTIQCQNCNNINPNDAKFCEKCGKKLPEFSNTSNSYKNNNTRTNGKPDQVFVNTPQQIRNKSYRTRTKTQTAGKAIAGFAVGSFIIFAIIVFIFIFALLIAFL